MKLTRKTTRVYKQNILLTETENLPKVKFFLDSLEREATRKIYLVGLAYAETFLKSTKMKLNLDTIVKPLLDNKVDRYIFVQEFINYLKKSGLSPRSIRGYLSGVKSYLANNRIYFIPQEYKARVREPKVDTEEEEAVDQADIRKILLACSDKRLIAYILVLATGGPRAKETLSLRRCDIDFTTSPTTIRLLAKHTKTRKERYFFISDEATNYLKTWIEHKYRPRDREEHNITRHETDYVFAVYNTYDTALYGMYKTLNDEFNIILKDLGMDEKKDGMRRRKITFHSLRRFVKSTISDYDESFSEWLLGHKKSSYWTKKSEVKQQKYLDYMKYLTFLDYAAVESTGKNIHANLEQKDRQIAELNEKIKLLQEGAVDIDRMNEVKERLEALEKLSMNKMSEMMREKIKEFITEHEEKLSTIYQKTQSTTRS